jgi:YidC/Oxa1 family membrane protein insertase
MKFSMEMRVFAAVFLCFGVLAIYQAKFAPPPPAPSPTATPAAATETPGTAPAVPAATPAAPAASEGPSAKPLVADAAARDIVVDTEGYTATFSTQGAVLKSYRLRHYADASGQPLELVPADLPAGTFPRPFTMSTDDPKESAALASALYQPSADSLSLGSTPGTLTFQYRDESGLNARKTFYFQPKAQEYLLNVEGSVDVGGKPRAVTFAFGPGIGLGYSPDGQRVTQARGLQFFNGSVQRLSAKDAQNQPRYEGKFRYAGVDDHYFVAVAILDDAAARADYAPVTVPVPGGAPGATRSFIAFSLRPDPGAEPSRTVTIPFFIGPKDFDKLRAADPQLVRAIDFGMFAFIVVPLMQALKWLNGYLGNYGWSIVVLTFLINIVIFPLRHRSMVSMKKMQAIQPEVKAIQDRYAKYKVTDPERQKMNSEMLALYKQKGVSPASGCVPMLLTMPILLAFYNLLGQAIELRGAPFIWWIHDLSAKDPTYIWPVLMGVTMFIQQRMMPTTADPMQQKIFLLMPVIFTVMFLSMPSGLVVYWLVSNVLTIGQQALTNRIIGSGRGGGMPKLATATRKG